MNAFVAEIKVFNSFGTRSVDNVLSRVFSESDLSWWLSTTTTWCPCSPSPRSPGQISPSARHQWAGSQTLSLSWGFVSIKISSILRIQLQYSNRSHKIVAVRFGSCGWILNYTRIPAMQCTTFLSFGPHRNRSERYWEYFWYEQGYEEVTSVFCISLPMKSSAW